MEAWHLVELDEDSSGLPAPCFSTMSFQMIREVILEGKVVEWKIQLPTMKHSFSLNVIVVDL